MSEKKSRTSRFSDIHEELKKEKIQYGIDDDNINEPVKSYNDASKQEETASEKEVEANSFEEPIAVETETHQPTVSDTEALNKAVQHLDIDETYVEEKDVLEADIKEENSEAKPEEIDDIVRSVLANMDEKIDYQGPIDPQQELNKQTTTTNNEEKPKKAKFAFGKNKKPKVVNPNKPKKSKWFYAGMILATMSNIGIIICFFIAYGPFNYLRDMFVTTAMRTMSHKYLANVLYSTDTIQEILANNVTIEPDEVMDSSAINMSGLTESQTVYSSVYEEQALKRDEGNDLYKVVRLNENGYKGYITFIYQPTAIELAVTRYLGKIGEYVTTMAKLNKAAVAINGGGFLDYGGTGSGGQPTGYVIKNGKIVWSRKRGSSWGGGTIGFNKDGILILTKKQGKAALNEGIYNGVDFGPFLVVNGKSAEVSGNGGWGVHPRTIIGQRKDGVVVFLTVDGRSATSLGVDLNVCIDILERYNVYNAANLDGGASTVLAIEGKLKNNPVAYTSSGEREVPTAWIVVRKDQTTE